MKKNWCEVQFLRDGRLDWPLENARVSGSVDGFFGGMTSEFRTDSRGIAIIEWYGDHDLNKIYVNGKTFEGVFENGYSYRFRF